jgi:hypothetical protein
MSPVCVRVYVFTCVCVSYFIFSTYDLFLYLMCTDYYNYLIVHSIFLKIYECLGGYHYKTLATHFFLIIKFQ